MSLAVPFMVNRYEAINRAEDALTRLTRAPDALADPLLVCALPHAFERDPQEPVRRLLSEFFSRSVAYGYENPRRYRWGLSHQAQPGSRIYGQGDGELPVHFRPGEIELFDESPSRYGRRLMEPIVLAAQFRFWGSFISDPESDPALASVAATLLDEATPLAEQDVASWFAGRDPWRDTLGLWLLSSEPEAMERLRDVLFSLALRGGGIANRTGLLRGTRFPFYNKPLVSANAALAAGLWNCGVYPTVLPRLVAFVASTREARGCWADDGQPPDILTTYAAADLLLRLDPDFDPEPTIDWLVRQQEPAGWWRALNPEVPWLTASLAELLRRAGRPFAERFSWPGSPIWARDRLSGLPTLTTLIELELMLAGLPALAQQELEVAFVDLAGFGAWNTAYGQVRGDEVIAHLGKTLAELPGVYAVRIGGDEFMLLGKPADTHGKLSQLLDDWRNAWPGRLAEIDAAGVAPRILVDCGYCLELRRKRDELGRRIARFKAEHADPPPTGVLEDIGRCG